MSKLIDFVERAIPITNKSSLACQLRTLATYEEEDIDEILKFLPYQLRNTEAFTTKLNPEWVYEYADFNSCYVNDILCVGGNTFHNVKFFYKILHYLNELDEKTKDNFYKKFAYKKQHQDTLAEFVPLFHKKQHTQIAANEKSYKDGRTIDWTFINNDQELALEVKHKQIIEQLIKNDRIIQKSYFKRTEDKFKSNTQYFQGLWMVDHDNHIDNIESLQKRFEKLDHLKIHFCIIGGWQNITKILLHPNSNQQKIIDTLKTFFVLPDKLDVICQK